MNKKRILAIFLVLVMSFSTLTVFADSSTENYGVSTEIPTISSNSSGGISTDSTSMPDEDDVYENDTYYTVSGSASVSNLYTNKCFYGVTSITYKITNNNDSKLTVKLRYYTSLGNTRYGDTITIPAGGTLSGTFDDLSSSKYYFIQFAAPSDFDGKVRGNE